MAIGAKVLRNGSVVQLIASIAATRLIRMAYNKAIKFAPFMARLKGKTISITSRGIGQFKT
ncbi:MAG: hypothetical protein COA71_01775 [SAR86 cluster bacterium]|uniref:Uncharacterized protein n=1 Tax=SAR86 cluster bacterium TaxID=2030880 RepID=A0A2A5CJT0_9GAMM|nr:MAG: hypothetical protein COA71_01775 [SAR86 cluster bacterium]